MARSKRVAARATAGGVRVLDRLRAPACYSAFHHQSVDDGPQLSRGDRRVNHYHRDALVRAAECTVVIAAADQHDNRVR